MHASGGQFGSNSRARSAFAPKIYYFNPLLAGPRNTWATHLSRCQDLGFDCLLSAPLFAPHAADDIFLTADHDRAHPAIASDQPVDAVIGDLAIDCRQRGLNLYLDLVLGRVGADATVAKLNPHWFASAPTRLDPRSSLPTRAVYARFDDPSAADDVVDWWINRLGQLVSAGAVGFRCVDTGTVPPKIWRRLIDAVKQTFPACRFLAWTPGVPWQVIQDLHDVGFSGAFSSLPWWNGRSAWLADEHRVLLQLGPVIGLVEAPFSQRGDERRADTELAQLTHSLYRAAAIGNGLMVPMGFEFGLRTQPVNARPDDFIDTQKLKIRLREEIREANALSDHIAGLKINGELRFLGDPEFPVTALLHADAQDVRVARSCLAILINTDLQREHPVPIQLDPLPSTSGMAASTREVVFGKNDRNSVLAPGEIRILKALPTPRIKARQKTEVSRYETAPRTIIDNVSPTVDMGRFAARRVVGEAVVVEADIFSDGHAQLAAELLWRAADKAEWQRVAMVAIGNDRWRATIMPERIGRHQFTIEAWWDRYGTFVRDLEAKHNAGADIRVEIMEGVRLLERARQRAEDSESKLISSALNWLKNSPAEASVEIFRTADLREVMHDSEERVFLKSCDPAFSIEIERPQAAFASWYELFPRSVTRSAARHGTFSDILGRLPAIRDMGFDVLYLTPVHPIGETNRKGKNNSLEVEPDDVGSSYAIGARDGGHDAIHPALGTLEDFRRLRDAAARHGLEIALDFAIQCSPDHPWLKEHPEWFTWRPDGSLPYAENPPKKYQDIVNVDFYAPKALPGLWLALRDIVLYWVEEGIRIFRVDNPHTKPLPFWEWLIGEVRGRNPDVIFLSEAFTRPKMMYRLAKVGFSQSYSYFTWRNTKQELIEYFTELTTTEVKEFFRPHLFVNTPDINPYFLQTSGRPGFLVRAALAATLSGLWGMYSGFEVCESAALPGREEYLDSEKYQIRVRDYDAAGNIVGEIAKLNRIRRNYPALHSHLGLRFYTAHDDQVLLYGKMTAGARGMILVAVSLDPFHARDVTIEVPFWHWNLPDDASVMAEDLMRETKVQWHGKLQRVRLDPALPFAIWHVSSAGQ